MTENKDVFIEIAILPKYTDCKMALDGKFVHTKTMRADEVTMDARFDLFRYGISGETAMKLFVLLEACHNMGNVLHNYASATGIFETFCIKFDDLGAEMVYRNITTGKIKHELLHSATSDKATFDITIDFALSDAPKIRDAYNAMFYAADDMIKALYGGETGRNEGK